MMRCNNSNDNSNNKICVHRQYRFSSGSTTATATTTATTTTSKTTKWPTSLIVLAVILVFVSVTTINAYAFTTTYYNSRRSGAFLFHNRNSLRKHCNKKLSKEDDSYEKRWNTINDSDDDDGDSVNVYNDDDDDDENGSNKDDFSTWIVSNLKQWPLLNRNSNNDLVDLAEEEEKQEEMSIQKYVAIPTTTATTTTIGSSSNSSIWNDVFGEIVKSTISTTTTSLQNAADITSYLRSPLLQVFNIETLLLQQQQEKESEAKIQGFIKEESFVNLTSLVNASTTNSKSTILESGPGSVTTQQQQPTITDSILKQAISRIETIVTDASNAVSSDKTVMTLLSKASELVRLSSSTTTPSITTSTTQISLPLEKSSEVAQPLSVKRPSTYLTNTNTVTSYAISILQIADGLLRKGYVDKTTRQLQALNKSKRQGDTSIATSSSSSSISESILKDVPMITDSNSLFHGYETAQEMNFISKTSSSDLSNTFLKAVEMGTLAGAIYEDTIPRTHTEQHTIVARGTSADVTWMVTDSLANSTSYSSLIPSSSSKRNGWDENLEMPLLVRTITIRGFDASDESVDREELLNRVCTATPVPLCNNTSTTISTTKATTTTSQQQQQQQGQQEQELTGILVHSGLLGIARTLYTDLKQYIDWTAPSHKIVLNGHSIGGSLAILVLLLMIQDYGIDYVRKNVVQVYTFGSPPVTVMQNPKNDVLSSLGLPNDFVEGYVQPWDPIVRLFTTIDALYPLASDLGPDNNTPFANGPPRTLRPILKTILVSWAGWPRFRENYKNTANQNYTAIGIQHILLPEPTRYLADRFLAVNIPVPPIETIVQISSAELYSALASIFPLDVFEVSYIPQAIRSFVHHFYPAYGTPLVDFVKELQRRSTSSSQQGRGATTSPTSIAFVAPPLSSERYDSINNGNKYDATTNADNKSSNPTGVGTAISASRNGIDNNNVTSSSNSNDGRIDWGKATQWLTTRYDTTKT